MGDVPIGAVHEAVVEEEGGPVTQEGVAFHLSQAHAALVLAALDGLSRELVHGARCSHLRVGGGSWLFVVVVVATYDGRESRGGCGSRYARDCFAFRWQGP